MRHRCEECGQIFDSEPGLNAHIGRVHGPSATTCSNCGKAIRREPSDIKRFENHFCNWDCRRVFRRKGREIACEWCGESVYKTKRDLENNDTHFCSKQCYGRYRSAKSLPNFSLDSGDGYPRWSLAENDDVSNIAVHQLVVIAYGADPKKVFNDRYNIHHENGCPIDNRPENLSVVDVYEHGHRDGGKRAKQYTWMDILSLVSFFLNPSDSEWVSVNESDDK